MALLSARYMLPSKDPPPPGGAGAARLVSSAPLPRDAGNVTASALKRDVKPTRGCPRIDLEEVEVTMDPVMVYFKIRVCPAGSNGASHHVMKKYGDLQNLHEALTRELPETTQLPKLPPEQSPQQAESSAFRACISSYLARLACNRDALESYSFQNFFQLSDDYNDRISALKTLQLNRVRSATDGGYSKSPSAAQASVPVGEAAASRPPQTDPSLDISSAAGSASPHAAAAVPKTAPGGLAAAVPKSAPGGLSKVGESEYSSADYGSSAETSAGASTSKTRKGRRRPWCIVCMSKPQEMAVDPCGHLSMCFSCSSQVKECPLCRGPVEKMLRIFVA